MTPSTGHAATPSASLVPPALSGLSRLVRGFVEGNYFYVVSAIVFLLGCKLLMRSPMFGDSNFARTLYTLLVLQGYEVLVIAAAVMIARHFRVLNDAFTLLIIELALLLDPTFFSNSFFTMLITESHAEQAVLVNMICLMLVPAKLVILAGLARVRLSPRVWLGMLAAAALIYLGPYPFSSSRFPFDEYGYYTYYMLGWGALLVALLMPPVTAGYREGPAMPVDYFSGSQRRWLPRFVVLLPLLIVVAHYVEHLYVHPIRFYWLFAAPPLMTLGALIVNNTRREGDQPRIAVGFLDALALLALLLTFFSSTTQGKEIVKGQVRLYPAAPDFFTSFEPLAVAGVVAAGIYMMAWLRLHYRPALIRVAILAALGAMALVIKSGIASAIVSWLAGLLKSGGQSVGTGAGWLGAIIKRVLDWIGATAGSVWIASRDFMAAHPWLIAIIIGAALIAVAWRWRNRFTWLLAGFYWILVGAAALPGMTLHWTFEIFQAICAWMIVCGFVFGDPRKERYVAAALMVVFGVGRYVATGAPWALGVAAAEGAALLAVGWWRRDVWLAAWGVAQGMALAGWLGRGLPALVSPSLATITGGLVLFVIGLTVTFRKTRILGLIQSWDEQHRLAHAITPPESRLDTSHLQTTVFIDLNDKETLKKLQLPEEDDTIHNAVDWPFDTNIGDDR